MTGPRTINNFFLKKTLKTTAEATPVEKLLFVTQIARDIEVFGDDVLASLSLDKKHADAPQP